MTLPRWISPIGLCEHLLVGAALTVCFTALHMTPAQTLIAVLVAAGAHEVGDGDLKRGGNQLGGWPWNGLLDVVAFLPAPLLRWMCT